MQRIIFFDGVCPLCNGFVDFVLKRDRAHQFMFTSLQSRTAALHLNKHDLSLNSIVLAEDKIVYRKSVAVLRILFAIGGWWTLLAVFISIFPNFIRDFVYDVVAKKRYQLFGKLDICRLPKDDEKKYFLE